jgi:hypothetical protein
MDERRERYLFDYKSRDSKMMQVQVLQHGDRAGIARGECSQKLKKKNGFKQKKT